MAATVTRYTVGNQAKRIADAFSSQNMAGGRGLPNAPGIAGLGAWYDALIEGGLKLAQTRYGTPPGMLVQETPQGTITYRQPSGSTTTLPVLPQQMGSQQYTYSTPEGFATGIATGTWVAIGIGVVALVLLTGKRR